MTDTRSAATIPLRDRDLPPVIDQLLTDYLLPYGGNTRCLYEMHLALFLRWCADAGLGPLAATRTHIELYIHYLLVEKGLKPSSVCTALTPVRGFYRFACYEGAVDRDPAIYARRPKVHTGLSDTLGLDRDQMRAFLAVGAEMGGRYYAAAFLLACMALRASEACSIRCESFEKTMRGHRVLEFVGKGMVPARMPLPVPVLRALEAAAGGRASGPLLLVRDGTRGMQRQGLNTLVATMSKRAGIESKVTSHVLRHSSITNALESGASLRKVQDLARHTEPRTTMRYDRNRTNLDDHAVHSLVAFVVPVGEDGTTMGLAGDDRGARAGA
ncbi:MAG: tyrosine-type recombinase/integrase [Nocardioidaceae bacterium]|nr:tyrosine-type recombinase/integrase [Nocardioidaceae bacterium]